MFLIFCAVTLLNDLLHFLLFLNIIENGLCMLFGDFESSSKVFQMLGYCPQFGGLFPRGVTLRAHLEAYGRRKGLPEAGLARHCDRVLAEFGLAEHAAKWVSKLSGGRSDSFTAGYSSYAVSPLAFMLILFEL